MLITNSLQFNDVLCLKRDLIVSGFNLKLRSLQAFLQNQILILQNLIHLCEDTDVKEIFDHCTSGMRGQLHERNKVAGTKDNDLMEHPVIELQYVLLKDLLIIARMGFLIK